MLASYRQSMVKVPSKVDPTNVIVVQLQN